MLRKTKKSDCHFALFVPLFESRKSGILRCGTSRSLSAGKRESLWQIPDKNFRG